MQRRNLVRTWLGISLTALAVGAAAETLPTRVAVVALDIKSQPVTAALNEFGQQTGIQVLFYSDVADGVKKVPALTGTFTPDDALTQLLSKTGLMYSYINERTVAIHRAVSNVLESETRKEPGRPVMRLAKYEQISEEADAGVATATSSQEGTVLGQEPAEERRSKRIEEIIVTASKRTESIQDIPVSVSTLSNEDIARKGVVGMSDYLRTLPGVSQIETGAGNNSIIMRGISAAPQTFDRGLKATTGYYLNDVPLTGNFRGGADVKLVDLDRVEVIRGPQGTLYGSASLGGAVRNIPNPPDLSELTGNVKAGYSHTENGGNNSSIEGVLNLPIVTGKLGIRAVGYRFDNSGYVDNIAGSDPSTVASAANYGVADLAINESDVGSDEYVGGRMSLLFQPIDNLKATLTFLTQDITQDGLPDVQPRLSGEYQQARLQLGEIVGGGGESLEDNLDIYSALIEYQFGWGSLLSSSALIREDYLEKRETGMFYPGAPPVPQSNPGETEAIVQEVRFVSEFEGPMQFLVGLYYDDLERRFRSRNYYGGSDVSANPFSDIVLTDSLSETEIKQKAVFSEVSYEWQAIKLTLGGRYFSYDDVTTDTTVDAGFTSAGVRTLKGENDGSTFKVNLAYEPADNTLFYAQWSEGFRLGSPVAQANPLCDLDNDGVIDGTNISAGPRTLDPDEMDSYELGSKLALLDGALIVNAAAYRNAWKGVPLRIVISCGLGADANAGEARTQGVELESYFYLTPSLRFTLGASYGEAELTRDAPGIGGLRGDRLPGTPKHTFNIGAQYEFDMLGRPSYVRGDYGYVGGFYNNLKETGLEAGDYGLLDIRAGMMLNQIELSLFVKNATNSDGPSWVDAVFTGTNARIYKLRPRTMGMSAHYRF